MRSMSTTINAAGVAQSFGDAAGERRGGRECELNIGRGRNTMSEFYKLSANATALNSLNECSVPSCYDPPHNVIFERSFQKNTFGSPHHGAPRMATLPMLQAGQSSLQALQQLGFWERP